MTRRKTSSQKTKGPAAFSFGSSDDESSYFKTRDMGHLCYIKSRNSPTGAVFTSAEHRESILAESERLVRYEGEAKPALLRKLGLTRPEQWRRYGSEAPYLRYRDTLRDAVGLNLPLRARRPKPEQVQKLSQSDRDIVLAHLAGEDVRKHPTILRHANELEQQKYFSAVKRRILKRLRIDLSIPWARQVAAASSGVYEFFSLDRLYRIPEHLRDTCFTEPTAMRIRSELEAELASRCNKMALQRGIKDFPIDRLAEIDLGPPEMNPLYYRADRITVDKSAWDALLDEGRPLHPYLTAHGQGAFGDIPLSEVEANWAAAEQFKPVTSRYKLKKHEVVLRTVYEPDEHGELLPLIQVSARPLSQVSAS